MAASTTTLGNKLAVAKEAQERGEVVEQRGAPSSVKGWLQHGTTTKQIARLLGSDEMAERWLRIALTECQRNPELFECTWESFAGALMQCAQLKLEPGQPLGLAWILPYKNSYREGGQWVERMEAQFQIGWPGVIQLALRSGQVAEAKAMEVCEGDEFGFDYLTGEKHHRPPYRGARGEAYGFYFHARFANGGEHFLYMTLEQCLDHAAKFSKSYVSAQKTAEKYHKDPKGAWFENRDAMCKKTTVLLSKRYMPVSPDWQRAFEADGRVTRLQGDKLVIDADEMGLRLGGPQQDAIEGESEEVDNPETGEKREPTPEEIAAAQGQQGMPLDGAK